MKKTTITVLCLLAHMALSHAQEITTDSLMAQSLPEVSITSEKVIKHTGFNVYIPSKLQLGHSANGLDLLNLLQLPGVKADPLEKAIISTYAKGRVLLRKNGVDVQPDDLLALRPEEVKRIEHVYAPGVKYGNDVAMVINIITHRETVGYALGLNTMNALTTNYNDMGAWGKWMGKHSEFGIKYNFKLNDIKKAFINQDETFRWNNGNTRERHSEGKYTGGNYRLDDIKLSYNYTLSQQRVIDVQAGFSWDRFPQRAINENVHELSTDYLLKTSNESNERLGYIQFYYDEMLTKQDNLTLNTNFSYMKSRYMRGFSSPAFENLYNVKGRQYGMKADLDYKHLFSQDAILMVGYKHTHDYTLNRYLAQNGSDIGISTNSQYLYTTYLGRYHKLGYEIGLGISRTHYGQEGDRHTFLHLRPALYLQYVLNQSWQLSYEYKRDTRTPMLSLLTNYQRHDDEFQVTYGNRDLHAYAVSMNTLVASYQKNTFSSFFFARYELANKVISSNPIIEKDMLFYHTVGNNNNLRHFETALNLRKEFLNRQLSIYVEPKYSYDHMSGQINASLANWSVQAGLNVFYKQFSLNAYYRTPIQSLNDETYIYQYSTSDINLGYRHKAFSAKLGVRNVLRPQGEKSKITGFSPILPFTIIEGNKGFGNMLYLSLSWSLSRGHQSKSQPIRRLEPNRDNGIVK